MADHALSELLVSELQHHAGTSSRLATALTQAHNVRALVITGCGWCNDQPGNMCHRPGALPNQGGGCEGWIPIPSAHPACLAAMGWVQRHTDHYQKLAGKVTICQGPLVWMCWDEASGGQRRSRVEWRRAVAGLCAPCRAALLASAHDAQMWWRRHRQASRQRAREQEAAEAAAGREGA